MNLSAPGLDGITNLILKIERNSAANTMIEVMKTFASSGYCPSEWKSARTILIYKGCDRENPGNWRRITITGVLYIAIFYKLAEGLHIVHEEEGINICNNEQKGFVPRRAGCVEHAAVVNALINDAVQKGVPIYILSLDLRDAFGSIPRDLIRKNLEDLGLPENIRRLVMDSYEDAFIQIHTKGGCTGRINIDKGVKQGCLLSSTLFNIGLDPLLRFLRKRFENFGYKYLR
jgi:hypothetical protein